MYGFKEITSGATVNKLNMSIQTIFRQVNLDEELTDKNGSFTTLNVSGRGNLAQRVNLMTIPKMDGAYALSDPKIEVREIDVEFKLKDKTNEGFRERVSRLMRLTHGNVGVLRFKDENDCYFNAILSSVSLPKEDANDLVGSLLFTCGDPYKYGEEETTLLTTIGDPDSTIVTLFAAQGTGQIGNVAPINAQPIFDVEFDSSTDHYEIKHMQTMRTIKVVYDFDAGDKLRIDATRRRIYINGEIEMNTLTRSSAWFDLQTGDNHFEVSPEGETATTIRYTPRYL